MTPPFYWSEKDSKSRLGQFSSSVKSRKLGLDIWPRMVYKDKSGKVKSEGVINA